MKKLLLGTLLISNFASAAIYTCQGGSVGITVYGNPVELQVAVPGINTTVKNTKVTTTFDTVITGSSAQAGATFKLTIKDASFGNPGDKFTGTLDVSSPRGVQTYSSLVCTKGNEDLP